MTYLQFHLVFLLPPICALAWFARPTAGVPGRTANDDRRAAAGLAAIVVLAVAYTTPWDNHLVATGVWGYPDDRVAFTLGHVPIEEYAFFVLQPVLAGLLLFLLARRGHGGEAMAAAPLSRRDRWSARAAGTAAYLGLAGWGATLLSSPSGTYLGSILLWAAPVGALQWAVGGHELAGRWRLWVPAAIAPTLYLWAADRAALALGIWWISPELTTGVHLWGLPVEEAVFFAVTNLMVVQGLLLFLVMVPGWGRRWTR